ncbi:EthD family reductase [Streptomyces carpinensis]|uniref:EthD family reductase n=1 Tax=Streptomyces carpinensis TaxID=66369 RepID=A0ABV1W4U5_9ACTN|nr:EthD family reductase [Streptomyces carpinensis]
MIKLTVLYEQPADTDAFDKHYLQTHTPLVRALPGLDRFEVALTLPDADGAPAPYHLIAELYFPDAQAMQTAMASPQGAALAADVPNLTSTKSVSMLSEVS